MIQNADEWWFKKRCVIGVLICCWIAGSQEVLAQVVLDGKFGTSGPVSGPAFNITADLGSVRGNNLFHSFQQFDLKSGDVATFSGPANVQNILTRVTGGAPSSIDGTIRSQITGANFFLINPDGLLFGPHAKINVSGSFAASTANYLKLADGAKFFASLDADDSTLTTAPVSAFGFLNGNAGAIEIDHSSLQTQTGKAISIIGGDVTMQGGSLRAAKGEINVASVKSAGEIPVNPVDLSAADFGSAFPTAGQIVLHDDARIDASGTGGGRVVIRGGSLELDNSRIEANTTGATAGRGIDIATTGALEVLNSSQINSLTPQGLGAGGNIAISADSIRMNGAGAVDPFFNPITQISSATGDMFAGGGAGKGGDISIKARNIELSNAAQISAATFGQGNAGRIDIEASHVSMDAMLNSIAQITANTQGFNNAGKAGGVHLKTDTLDMLNGATILAASFGSGIAGVIDVEAQSMNLLRASVIAAPASGSGLGGNIEIKAQSLVIDGQDIGGGGIQAVTGSLNLPTPGGSIHIDAGTMTLNHSASVFTSSFGAGKGGDINVTADRLTLANGSSIRASGEQTGAAGTISVNVIHGGDLTIASGSAISTSAPGSSGGNVNVAADSKILLASSEINAQAGRNGGNITVAAPDLIYLWNSRLTGQADTTKSGHGNGGNLTIEPGSFLILNDGSLISKSTFGNGGNISILADNFFKSTSLIDASAPFGLAGTVKVTAPESDLSGSLIGLPSNLLDAGAQLRPDCGVRLSGNLSSFVVLGRGGLPLEPGGFLPSGMVSTASK